MIVLNAARQLLTKMLDAPKPLPGVAQRVSRRERLELCTGCPSVQRLGYKGKILRCTECQCWCDLKTAIPAESCPLNRW